MRQTFDTALKELGTELELGPLALDQDGTAAIGIDDVEIGMIFIGDTQEIQLYAIVGAIPDDADDRFFSVLLSANNMGAATGGAALAVNDADNAVTINRRHSTDKITSATLSEALQRFADTVEGWRQNYELLTGAVLQAASGGRAATTAPNDAWIKI